MQPDSSKPSVEPSSEGATDGGQSELPRVQPKTFRTARDWSAVAIITVAALIGVTAVWWYSDARATVSTPAVTPLPSLTAPTALPTVLTQAWQVPSDGTQKPVVNANVVVSGHNGKVLGRDPLTGEVRWRYERDLPLCTISLAFNNILAVFQRGDTCSEVTALSPATGKRVAQRNGDAELNTRLLYDGTHVTITGQRYVETWRSDLVKTQEYGQVRQMVQPNKQPRTGCEYGSVAVIAHRVGVVERCPEDPGDRLTVLKPNPKDWDQPEVAMSTVLPGTNARVIALSADKAAVALPNPARLVIYDAGGVLQAEYPLALPETDLRNDLPGRAAETVTASQATCPDGTSTPLSLSNTAHCADGVPVSTSPAVVYWFTGSRTIALSATSLIPLWTVENTRGPGTLFAQQLLIPTDRGLLVLDPATGTKRNEIPINRGDYQGPVFLASSGPMLLEQRGSTLVALR